MTDELDTAINPFEEPVSPSPRFRNRWYQLAALTLGLFCGLGLILLMIVGVYLSGRETCDVHCYLSTNSLFSTNPYISTYISGSETAISIQLTATQQAAFPTPPP